MANQGMTAEEIKKKLEENAYNSSIYIAVDTLEYLKKGGRVTALSLYLQFRVKSLMHSLKLEE